MKKEVKKQVGAIRVSNEVGLLARKAWNVLLINAYDDLLTSDKFRVSVKELSEAIGYNSNDKHSLLQALDKLQTSTVEWDIGGQSEKKGVSFSGMSKVQMLGGITVTGSTIIYEYSPMLKEILYNPVIYQTINASQQKLFNTGYGLCLWENCFRFINVGNTGMSTVDEWRKLLGATAQTYDAFKKLNEMVLTPAVREVNGFSNISIKLITRKTGRRITHIGFSVEKSQQQCMPISDGLTDVKQSPECKKLKGYGVSEIMAVTLIQEHGYKYVKDKISLLEKGEDISNPAGYLIKAIQEDWKDKEVIKKTIKAKKYEEERDKDRKIEEEAQKVKKQKELKREKIREYLADIGENAVKELESKFLEENRLNPVIKRYVKGDTIDTNSASIKSIFYSYVFEKHINR